MSPNHTNKQVWSPAKSRFQSMLREGWPLEGPAAHGLKEQPATDLGYLILQQGLEQHTEDPRQVRKALSTSCQGLHQSICTKQHL